MAVAIERPRTLTVPRLRVPVTLAYVTVVGITTIVLGGMTPSGKVHVLRHLSTNLHNMGNDPIRVLVASAFVVRGSVTSWLVPMALVLVPAELWFGSLRTLVVAVVGHVGASLATTAGIWWVTLGGKTHPHLVHTVDVGVSYVVYAVAASLVYRLPARWRVVPITAMVGAGVRLAIVGGTYTDWGHMASLAIGLSVGALLGLSERARPAFAH
jgi:rhomboid family protein